MASRNGLRIGIALGDREAVGVVLGKKGAPSARVSLSLGEEGSEIGAEVARAFGALREAMDQATGGSTAGAAVYVALLPPLADARLVPFPPMRKAEVEAVLGRDVARYFLGANRPQVVGVRLPRRNGNGRKKNADKSVSVLAAAAPLALLETVRSAFHGVGWSCVSFSAAHGSWLASAFSSKGTPVGSVVAVIGPTAHVLRLEGTDPVAVRQLPASEPSAVADAVGGFPGRVLVLASPQVFEALRGPFAGAGLTASLDPGGWPEAEEATAGWAAKGPLELVPPIMASERRKKTRKTGFQLAGAAVVLIFASLAAQLWGAHRELGIVRGRRASIEAEVAPLLLARDSLTGLVTQIESMDQLSRNTPVWTRSLVELAALLPMDTYLTGFFASGDTVELEAAGTKAGEAIQVLSEAGLFEEIRLQGLVERDLEEGTTVVERFRLWARLPQREGGGS